MHSLVYFPAHDLTILLLLAYISEQGSKVDLNILDGLRLKICRRSLLTDCLGHLRL